MAGCMQPYGLLDFISDIADYNTDLVAPADRHSRQRRGRQIGQQRKGWMADAVAPAVDLYDGQNEISVVMHLPAVKKEDLKVDLDPQTKELVVSGEIKRSEEFNTDEAGKSGRVSELYYGNFERRVSLGSESNRVAFKTDGISAKLNDGVLVIKIPKANAEPKHRITVS